MSYKVMEDKLSLLVDNIEAGYIKFDKTEDGIEVIETYIFPGFRENGYAQRLVEYMTDNYDDEVSKIKCSYYRIMSGDYKLAKIEKLNGIV